MRMLRLVGDNSIEIQTSAGVSDDTKKYELYLVSSNKSGAVYGPIIKASRANSAILQRFISFAFAFSFTLIFLVHNEIMMVIEKHRFNFRFNLFS